jgi:hypothetical protein
VKRLFPDHLGAILQEFEVLTVEEQDELARLCRKVGLWSEPDAESSRN